MKVLQCPNKKKDLKKGMRDSKILMITLCIYFILVCNQ